MNYPRMKFCKLLSELDSEEKARAWIWLAKFDGKEFICPQCGNELYWQHHKNPEIRECKKCHFEVRLRAHTIFQKSKTPLLIWLRAICLVTQGKRGISALELQADLGMKSYGTAWILLHKIREALRQRDEIYKLKNVIELDGAVFGRRQTGNQVEVLVAVETKDWIDQKGRRKPKAGFAKVLVAKENKEEAQKFVDGAFQKNSMVNTDGSPSLVHLENVDVDYQVVGSDPEMLDHWLPWVHKFISNAKSWIIGTHHGVEAKYLSQYLAEYTFRFNRRHDPDSLFFRALGACVHAKPTTSQALCG
ncbi:MAG: IS1595 family transposase [Alphaproteobacteria bacterium]|nr:IS1595 family transposase [Alphaproteobacteria bacterium]